MGSKQSAATIQDVARAAGVSVSTASRVLNNKDDVSPETYEKVRRVMQEMNYVASLAAKSMRSRATNVIGLLVPQVTDIFYQQIIHGVGLGIRDSGYDLMIYTAERPGLSKSESWEQEHVALLSNGLTDGCIVVTPMAPTFPDGSRVVVVDPQGDGANVPSIVTPNREGALEGMRYLIALGHRRIGFISGHYAALSSVRRSEAYRDALAEAGIAYLPDLVRSGDFTRERGYAAALELLRLPEPPTAIFAANDKSAIGALDAARDLGLAVPRDLSILGFDNIPEATQVAPKLTTVDQAIQEMGTLAIQLLFSLLKGEDLAESRVLVPTQLIKRDSCQPPRD